MDAITPRIGRRACHGAARMSGADGGGRGTVEFLPELAGLLLSEETVSGMLDLIVNLAVSGVEGVAGASVSMVVRNGDQVETSNASSEMIRIVDEAQYQDSAGPCVEAIRTGQEVRVAIPVPAWAAFSEGAAQAGVRTVWSLPLRVRQRTTGALNLYATSQNPGRTPRLLPPGAWPSRRRSSWPMLRR